MEFRVLRSFLAVAREQSITGAARTLHITQPSLSRQIMDLEEELGTKLFERGSRKITLTSAGTLLRKRAEQIMELARKTSEEIAGDGEVSGAIYIGAGETWAFKTLAAVLRDLIEQAPDVYFHLHSGNAEDVMERLDKGLLDFGLFIEPHDVTKYNYLRLPTIDTWGVLMRKDSPLARLKAIRVRDLLDKPLICSRQSMSGGQLASWFGLAFEKLKLIGSYNLLFNASLMVEAGAGYAICLDGIVNTAGESDLCFRPLAPSLKSYVDIVWKKQQIFSRPSELFLSRLRKYLEGETMD